MDISNYLKLFYSEAKKWHKEILNKSSHATCPDFLQSCSSVAASLPEYHPKMRTLQFGGDDIRKMNTDPQGNLLFTENCGSAFRVAPGCYFMTDHVKHTGIFICCGIATDGKAIALGDIQSDLHVQPELGHPLLSIHSSSGTHSETHFLDSSRFISGCGNNICYIWDINNMNAQNASTYPPVQSYYGGENEFLSLDYNRETCKEFAASFTSDCIKIFDIDSKQYVKNITLSTSPSMIKYFPDNKSLICYNKDASIMHVDIGTSRVLWKHQLDTKEICIPCFDCSSSGRFIFYQSPLSGIMNAYDIIKGKVTACTEKITEYYTDIKRSHDGRLMYACCKKNYIAVVF